MCIRETRQLPEACPQSVTVSDETKNHDCNKKVMICLCLKMSVNRIDKKNKIKKTVKQNNTTLRQRHVFTKTFGCSIIILSDV